MSSEARREYAANRILEDERLRGPLDDVAYAPLQRWALDWVDAYALATAGIEDDTRARQHVDAGVAWVRTQIEALVSVLTSWPGCSPLDRAAQLAEIAPGFPAPGLASATCLAERDSVETIASEIASLLPPAPR